MTQPNSQKKKIVILGGGAASLTTAFELTSQPGWQDRYDITLYQMGWRLGGKGASGRNLDEAYHYRIEEHGVHIWFGLYDNAFRVMQRCYRELNRPPDAPLGTWEAAFKPHSLTVLQEKVNDQWQSWPIVMPTNDQVPGDDTLLLPLFDYLVMGVKFMHENFGKLHQTKVAQTQTTSSSFRHSLRHSVRGGAVSVGHSLMTAALKLIRPKTDHSARPISQSNGDLFKWLGVLLTEAVLGLVDLLMGFFMAMFWPLVKDNLDTNADERHLWLLLNFAYGNLCGVIKDRVLERGFDYLNKYEYREWLGKYLFDDGGRSLTSPLLSALYDGIFAYERGDLESPNLAAGVALRTYTRLYLTYKGAIMWKMQAGMGDVVFAPLYEVLQRRGVKFEFFQRVKKLTLSTDKKSIARIDLGQQVTLKNKNYVPLFNVKGLPCWPSTPFYDQIVEGHELQKQKVNLESFCSPWPDVKEIQLESGKDFDQVVLGISIGALPYIAGELIEANADWQTMVKYVNTVRTQAFQLWLKPTAYELGWTMMGKPVLTSYDITPLDTWADMSHLINHENWTSQVFPLNIAYFCGPMKDDPPTTELPCPRPEEYAPLAKRAALDLLNRNITPLWPKFVLPATGKPNWNLLIDDRPGHHVGQERFDSQYWRANVDPSERYVLSEKDSLQYRLKPGQSGFENLVITGDWTDNGFNVGCVEATVMSGMLASNAICGYPKLDDITGLNF